MVLYVGEGSKREQWPLLHSVSDFSHFPHYPQAKWALLVLIPGWMVCVHSRILWISPVNSPVRMGVSPAATSTPMGVFNQWFEALFPLAGTLGCTVCLAPQLVLPVYLHSNVGPPAPLATASPGLPATALPQVLSAPPTGLDECFFFNSLLVGLPYSLIFCQF